MQEPLDLFLLVGQSNMAGRGILTEADRVADPRILVLDANDHWSCQGEPLHFDKSLAGVGLAFTFAKRIADQYPNRKIGLIPCAVGGTPLERWNPGGDLYTDAVKRAKVAQERGSLRAILWHQGEQDAKEEKTAQTYAERLVRTIEGFRSDLSAPDAPFIAGELGEFLLAPGHRIAFAHLVNAQITSLKGRVAKYDVVAAAGLGHIGDNLHFNADSLKEFGRRYAAAYFNVTAA